MNDVAAIYSDDPMLIQADLQFTQANLWNSTAAVFDPKTNTTLEYQDLITKPSTNEKWLISAANEFG